MTLVVKRMDVFRDMTLVICNGNCLQECELKHWSVPEEPRWLDLSLTYCTRLYVGQPIRQFYVHEMTLDPMCV